MKNFKKIVSLVLVVVSVFAMSTIAFAVPNSGVPVEDQYSFCLDADRCAELKEEPMWDYDSNYRYTDFDGTVWRYCSKKNYKIAPEHYDPEHVTWLYKEFDDGRVHITYMNNTISSSYDIEEARNIVIPSTVDGKAVTDVEGAGTEDTLSITVPDGVTRIEEAAFYNYASLKRVIIPASVKSIEWKSFMHSSTDGVDIYYAGTEEQWNDIVVWNHTTLLDPNIWAVTNFDWSAGITTPAGRMVSTDVRKVYFNVDPDTLEPLMPEEEKPQQTIFEKILLTIIEFFKTIVSWFTFGK